MTRKRYTRIPQPSKDTKNGKGAQHLGRHQVYNNRSEKSRGQLFPSKWVEIKLMFFCRIIIKSIHVLHVYNVIIPEKMHLYKSMLSKPWVVKKMYRIIENTHTRTHKNTRDVYWKPIHFNNLRSFEKNTDFELTLDHPICYHWKVRYTIDIERKKLLWSRREYLNIIAWYLELIENM